MHNSSLASWLRRATEFRAEFEQVRVCTVYLFVDNSTFTFSCFCGLAAGFGFSPATFCGHRLEQVPPLQQTTLLISRHESCLRGGRRSERGRELCRIRTHLVFWILTPCAVFSQVVWHFHSISARLGRSGNAVSGARVKVAFSQVLLDF